MHITNQEAEVRMSRALKRYAMRMSRDMPSKSVHKLLAQRSGRYIEARRDRKKTYHLF